MTGAGPSESTQQPRHAWGLGRVTRGHVILIGYRGSGKSTVGPLLADRLDLPFVDTDEQIALRTGKTIAELFQSDGEQTFRDHERTVIAEVCRRDPHVIAVGGGAVVDEENVAAMRQAGAVVWLTATADTLWNRIAADSHSLSNRPDLTSDGGLTELRRLLGGRRSLYRSATDYELDTDQLAPSVVADRLIRQLTCGGDE